MWWLLFSVLALVTIWKWWTEGPYRALGVSSILALLIPTWVVHDFFGFDAGIRVGVGVFALGLYCLHRDAVIWQRLVPVDFAGLALVAIHIASDWTNDGFNWLVLLKAYGEWFVPYVVGRLAVRSWQDARALAPWFVLVTIVFAVAAISESLVGWDLFEALFGRRPQDIAPHRWGLVRAYGPVTNPIYFGNLLLMLMPWTLYAWILGRYRLAPGWWRIAPIMPVVGILLCASRAPILGIVLVILGMVFVARNKWRTVIAATSIIGVVLGLLFYREGLDLLQRWAGETNVKRERVVNMEGKTMQYTGTLHRLYLFQVYGKAMKNAGPLGYGSDRTAVFPPLVPIDAEHAEAMKKMWCVDNFYVLIVLRFGFLGLVTFAVLGVTAVATAMQIGMGSPEQSHFKRGDGSKWLAGALSGGVIGALFVLMTVWMPSDYGFWFMWTVGAIAGLAVYVRNEQEEDR